MAGEPSSVDALRDVLRKVIPEIAEHIEALERAGRQGHIHCELVRYHAAAAGNRIKVVQWWLDSAGDDDAVEA